MDELRALRVAIVDDEPLVRKGLRRSLAALAGDGPEDADDGPEGAGADTGADADTGDSIEIVGEAGDGPEAVRLLEEARPDLVFLDVQMPEMDGFQVLEALAPETRPAVIFVTAYDAYAIRAFEVHAVDYLLKPFDDGRLAEALRRARDRIAAAREDPERVEARSERLEDLLRDLGARSGPRRLMVRSGGRIRFVPVDDLDWLEASGNYVRLHAGERSYLLREPLSDLVERLDDRFLRVHRSAAVNLERVEEVRPLPTGDARLFLRDGTELRLSRTRREAFDERMAEG